VTPADLLDRELRRDGARPLITWYDDATGDRVELSVATAANWAAKIANHLLDEEDVQPGDVVAVEPALHWITAVLMLGVWTAGGQVTTTGTSVLDITRDAMGMGLSRVVGSQPDQYAGSPADEAAAALSMAGRTWTHLELAVDALHAASHHGIGRDSRVLTTLAYDTVDGLDAGLLAPLAVGGSVVLVASADEGKLAERCASENVTHTAGVAVSGLPRLDAGGHGRTL
jgi:acyl-CoA synthetase (AMP-forming)/AMP-acid ligase II